MRHLEAKNDFLKLFKLGVGKKKKKALEASDRVRHHITLSREVPIAPKGLIRPIQHNGQNIRDALTSEV